MSRTLPAYVHAVVGPAALHEPHICSAMACWGVRASFEPLVSVSYSPTSGCSRISGIKWQRPSERCRDHPRALEACTGCPKPEEQWAASAAAVVGRGRIAAKTCKELTKGCRGPSKFETWTAFDPWAMSMHTQRQKKRETARGRCLTPRPKPPQNIGRAYKAEGV